MMAAATVTVRSGLPHIGDVAEGLQPAAIFAIPTAAFSESVYIGPGGVRIGPSHHGYHNRYEGGGRCAELRQACLHKQQLGEQGMGNCQRYRALCH
jgi:hypothetical protein